MNGWRRHRPVVAAVVLLTCLAGPVARSAATGTAAIGCAWLGETDQRDVNIGAPDLDAHYWLTPVVALPGTHLRITGQFVHARYFSFAAYDPTTKVLDSIYDRQVRPSQGVNPFRHRIRAGQHSGRYAVTVRFTAIPKHRRPNTIYADPQIAGHSVPLVLLEYRVYAPTDPQSHQGGVPFPAITTYTAAGQPLLTLGGCAITPPSFGAPLWELAAALNYPPDGPTPAIAGASRIPVWQRQFGSDFQNPQNAYLATTIARHWGPMVVIHTRAPSFPDTNRGVDRSVRRQVRYWSICTYDTGGQFVYGCAADYHAAIRRHMITYVISDPGARPANANAKHGVTWLPWGGIQSGAQILYRNMLPSPSFRHAAQQVTKPGQNAKKLMGRYYPRAVYCTTERFERGSWKACFRAAHDSGAAT